MEKQFSYRLAVFMDKTCVKVKEIQVIGLNECNIIGHKIHLDCLSFLCFD